MFSPTVDGFSALDLPEFVDGDFSRVQLRREVPKDGLIEEYREVYRYMNHHNTIKSNVNIACT